jgi:hypothetical protein
MEHIKINGKVFRRIENEINVELRLRDIATEISVLEEERQSLLSLK